MTSVAKPDTEAFDSLIEETVRLTGELACRYDERERVLGDFDQVLQEIDRSLGAGHMPFEAQARLDAMAAQLLSLDLELEMMLRRVDASWTKSG